MLMEEFLNKVTRKMNRLPNQDWCWYSRPDLTQYDSRQIVPNGNWKAEVAINRNGTLATYLIVYEFSEKQFTVYDEHGPSNYMTGIFNDWVRDDRGVMHPREEAKDLRARRHP